jgi:DNA-binding winged helix-turn-helix (wHTH) protein
MSNKPWMILNYLIERPKRVVSTAELIAQVWVRSEVEDETVGQQVRTLRSLLTGDEPGSKWITTVRGQGFKLDADVRIIPEIEEASAGRQAEALRARAKELSEKLLNPSPDPHDHNYIGPVLLQAKRLGKQINASEAFFKAIDVLVRDIDAVRLSVTYPAPAHLSVNDLDLVIDELQAYASDGS